ncbi:MAG TPA: cupin domain-containing protein [Verrucomicrobiae bacterium]|nr:cupin domain-containing protein [Verrucomicrobiae bacterium]
MSSESQYSRQLAREGFSTVYVWQDAPNAFYPDHVHMGDSAHVILEGELSLTMRGNARTYREGDRVDVPGGTVHSAKIGPAGCRYLIGEK